MTAEFRPIVVNLLLVAAFAIAIITGGLAIAELNNAPISIGDDPAIAAYAESLNDSVLAVPGVAQSSEDALSNSPTTETDESIIFSAIGGLWKTLKNVPSTVYNLTVGLLFDKVFGNEQAGIIFGIIGAIMTITLIFAVWRLVSQGDSG